MHDGKGLFAATRGQHFEVLGVEPGLQELDVGENVVNDQNAGSHRVPLRDQTRGAHASPRYRRTAARNVTTEIGLEI